MGIKVKAIERNVNFAKKGDKEAEAKYMFVMQPELYGKLNQEKVIAQAALNCGMPKAAMTSAVNAYGAVVSDWATEGHSIPIPGLGTIRFGVRSNAVTDVSDVKTSLITTRRFIFTPTSDLKKALAATSISITCYDRNGEVVKTVTSDDKDDIEDPENEDKNNAGKNPSDSKDNTDKGDSKGDSGKEDAGSGNTEQGGSGTGDSNPDGSKEFE